MLSGVPLLFGAVDCPLVASKSCECTQHSNPALCVLVAAPVCWLGRSCEAELRSLNMMTTEFLLPSDEDDENFPVAWFSARSDLTPLAEDAVLIPCGQNSVARTIHARRREHCGCARDDSTMTFISVI